MTACVQCRHQVVPIIEAPPVVKVGELIRATTESDTSAIVWTVHAWRANKDITLSYGVKGFGDLGVKRVGGSVRFSAEQADEIIAFIKLAQDKLREGQA